jgi:hypothetical protein
VKKVCIFAAGSKMKLLRFVVAAAAAGSAVVQAAVLSPPVLPLFVRNPYLSTWLGNARGKPWHQSTMFYTGEEVYIHINEMSFFIRNREYG